MNPTSIPTAEPARDLLFPIVNDAYGPRLALVFGNEAREGKCPFVTGGRCHHCDIGRGEGSRFDLKTNHLRLDWFQAYYQDVWHKIAHLVIYNSGSVLNPAEMSPELLDELMTFARNLPALQVVSLDSRESFVTEQRIVRLAQQLRTDQALRVVLGLESANDHIRNALLQKEMPEAAVQRALDRLEDASLQSTGARIGLDINIVVAGPGTTSDTAAEDAAATAQFALSRSKVPVDFNLHPYYPSSGGRDRFPNHQRCSMPTLLASLQAVSHVCQSHQSQSKIFVGLHTEGHDFDLQTIASVSTADQFRPPQVARDSVREFNESQDTRMLVPGTT